ncbi:MAG TPA: nucleotidyltransferase family protein [Segetibacter sp.]|nr:nucleotidyltransferase family protein [Segetibacter sp.]
MVNNLNKEKILSTLTSNKEVLEKFGVWRIGLFGSYATGSAGNDSDVDLLVDFKSEKKTLKNLVELGEYLEILFAKKVDIVTPQGLSKYIGPYILKEVKYASLQS